MLASLLAACRAQHTLQPTGAEHALSAEQASVQPADAAGDRAETPVVLTAGANAEPVVASADVMPAVCNGQKLLVIAPPDEGQCALPVEKKHRQSNWRGGAKETCSPFVPCAADADGCEDYAAQCAASSWFVPGAYRLPHYKDQTLQRTWLMARLLATKDGGVPEEPCVTHDATDPEVAAVLLLHPMRKCSANETEATLSLFEREAAKVPEQRRFVMVLDRTHALLFRMLLHGGLARAGGAGDLGRAVHTIRSNRATLVNRGGAMHVWPASGVAAGAVTGGVGRPWSGLTTFNMARSTQLGDFLGWPTNIDSPFMPASSACLTTWQQVLRSGSSLPNISAGARGAAAIGPYSSGRPTLIASNGEAHGVSSCLRKRINAACANQPNHVCVSEAKQLPGRGNGAPFGVTADGSPASCDEAVPFYELYSRSTFCLMAGGDGMDRGATVQALDVGCIPVFFDGTGRGDVLREAFSRSFFGTDDADRWSVLVSEYELLGCAPSADEEGCPEPLCESHEAVGERLLDALELSADRIRAMREYIIATLPSRVQAYEHLPGAHDFVDRFVTATLTASSTTHADAGGSPASWPLDSETAASALSPQPSEEQDRVPPCRRYHRGGRELCKPGFLVIGPQKTGTSALWTYLRTHPQVMSHTQKELMHFSSNLGKFNCSIEQRETYLDRFTRVPASSGKITGDFSATDFACPCCPSAIQSVLPHAKLIILLRDPLERAESRWAEQSVLKRVFNKRELRGSFDEYARANLPALDACLRVANTTNEKSRCTAMDNIFGPGVYLPLIENWQLAFPASKLLFIDSATLEERPVEALRRVERHLGLRRHEYDAKLLGEKFNTRESYGWKTARAADDRDGSEDEAESSQQEQRDAERLPLATGALLQKGQQEGQGRGQQQGQGQQQQGQGQQQHEKGAGVGALDKAIAAMGEAMAVAEEGAANAISAANISAQRSAVALYETDSAGSGLHLHRARPKRKKTCDDECIRASQPSAAATTCVRAFYGAHLTGLMSVVGTERLVGKANFVTELDHASDEAGAIGDKKGPCRELLAAIPAAADDVLALAGSAQSDHGASPPSMSLLLQRASERVYAPPVRWLAVERAGENFVSTVWRFACSGCNVSHASIARSAMSMSTITQLQRSMRDEGCCDSGRVDDSFIAYMPAQPIDIKTGGIALMLRDPARRMLSAYLYAASANASANNAGEEREVMSLAEWISQRQRYGCQTNLLVGRACSQVAAADAADDGVEVAPWQEPTSAEVSLAVQMVGGAQIQFVGVYEHWDESVALFHAIFTGGHDYDRRADLSPPQVIEDLNRTSVLMKELRTHSTGIADKADQAVYDQGRARFLRDLRTYGLVG